MNNSRAQERPALPHPNERITVGKAAKLCRISFQELATAVASGEIASSEELRRVTLVRFGDVIQWFNSRGAKAGER